MDPATLVAAGVAFIGSTIVQKSADAALSAAWIRIVDAFRRHSASDPTPADLVPGGSKVDGSPLMSVLVTEARLVFGQSSSLKRASLVSQVFKGAELLWVDDNPGNNEWEASTFTAFGAHVSRVVSTADALAFLSQTRVDLVLSDIARTESDHEGVDALPALQQVSRGTPVVLYTGVLRPEFGIPRGAFGITNRPDELLHLVLDVLERKRIWNPA